MSDQSWKFLFGFPFLAHFAVLEWELTQENIPREWVKNVFRNWYSLFRAEKIILWLRKLNREDSYSIYTRGHISRRKLNLFLWIGSFWVFPWISDVSLINFDNCKFNMNYVHSKFNFFVFSLHVSFSYTACVNIMQIVKLHILCFLTLIHQILRDQLLRIGLMNLERRHYRPKQEIADPRNRILISSSIDKACNYSFPYFLQ